MPYPSAGYTAPAYQTASNPADAYQPPAEWNRFNPNVALQNTNVFRPASSGQNSGESLLTPSNATTAPVPIPDQLPGGSTGQQGQGQYAPAPVPATQQAQNYSSPYNAAINAPWQGDSGAVCGPEAVCAPQVCSMGPISPWFGGNNILFYSVANSGNRACATDDAAGVGSRAV